MATYNTSNKHLRVADFQHPADKRSVAAVMAVPGLNTVLEFISKNSLERVYSFVNNSSRMKVSPEMAPKMFQMLEEAADMYGESHIPDIYIERNYSYYINLDGMAKPYVVFPSSWLEIATDDMLWSMLSAQIAGIQAKHGTIEFIGNIIDMMKGMLPPGVDVALDLAIKDWKRNREYTYDRAHLLATENFEMAAKNILSGDAPMHVLDSIELGKPNNTYYQQAVEFLKRSGLQGGIQKFETVLSNGQWLASRYIELYNWYYSGEYHEVLEGSIEA